MEYIRYETIGHIGVITIDKPPVNAVSAKLYVEIGDIFQQVQQDENVWVVILKSDGKYFSVGNEMSEIGEFTDAHLGRVRWCLQNAAFCTKPIVCAVQGGVVGAMLALIASADIVVASEEAYFVMGETNIGLIGVNNECSLSMPLPALRYMTLTGERVTARDMYRLGWIYDMVEKDKLYERALGIAQKIESKPPLSIQESKLSIQRLVDVNGKYRVGAELDYKTNRVYLSKTRDFAEATKAFMEKRKPTFIGE